MACVIEGSNMVVANRLHRIMWLPFMIVEVEWDSLARGALPPSAKTPEPPATPDGAACELLVD